MRPRMTRKQRRLALIGTGLGVLGLAAALVLFALRDAIVFFNSPTDVVEKHVAPGSRIRLGGLVKPGTLVRGDNLLVLRRLRPNLVWFVSAAYVVVVGYHALGATLLG